MAHVSADRVRTTAVNIGSGAVSVAAAAPTGYRTFSAVLANGDTCYYTIQHQTSGQWEVGLGTYTSATNTLARTTIISSSNANLLVTFNTGTVDIFITAPASKMIQTAADDTATLPVSSKVGTALITPQGPITASGLTAATARLLGRATAATGAVEEITLGTGLSFSGTTLNASGGTGVANVKDFGAKGDNSTDDTDAFNNAIKSLAPRGGTVIVPPGRYVINGNVFVGIRASAGAPQPTSPLVANVYLVGPTPAATQGLETSEYANYANISLSPSASIWLGGMSGIQGLRIIRQGLTYSATAASTFSGTAVQGAGAQEVSVKHCMILGFTHAVVLVNCPGSTVDTVYFDCTNGIWIDYSLDVTRVMNCHGFPFTTDTSAGGASKNNRSGIAYRFTTQNDWTLVSNCMSFGYNRGYYVTNLATIQFIGCSADNTQVHANSAGFYITNLGVTPYKSCVHLNSCLAAAAQDNFYFNAVSANVIMTNCESWGAASSSSIGYGINVDSGYVVIGDTYSHDNTTTGLLVSGGTVYTSNLILRGNPSTQYNVVGGTLNPATDIILI